MSQRNSGFDRIDFDQYETPEWVTQALLPYIPDSEWILEPACGSGKMATALQATGNTIVANDIQNGTDFLAFYEPQEVIITNPPYSIADAFIKHALYLTRPQGGVGGFVAMLLRCDFDHAKRRAGLFSNHPAFSKKIVLTKRIKWIEGSKGSPSFNHAWFVWDWRHKGKPTIEYSF